MIHVTAKYLFLLVISFSPFYLLGQTAIQGTVRDVNGNSLQGVNVVLKGTDTSISTSQNGSYTILVKEPQGVLVFSFVGLQTVEESIDNRENIDIVLYAGSDQLEEVVIVGYGSQSRESLTTSISKLDNKVLDNVPYSNPASALQGTIAGLRVQSVSGQPGAAPRVILRGGTSINNPNGSQPLYIIDGVLRDQMNHLNTDDIESLQVLKDAASTAIYGARGSNGVVIITTKSGKSGQSTVNYRYNLGASTLSHRLDMLGARDYIYFNRLGVLATGVKNPGRLTLLDGDNSFGLGNANGDDAMYDVLLLTDQNRYLLEEGWEQMSDPVDPSRTIIFKGTDWQDVLFQTGFTHNHSLSFSGGNEKGSVSASVGYITDNGIALKTEYDRLTFNLNGDYKVRDNLTAFARAMYASTSNQQVYNTNHLFERIVSLAPTTRYRNSDGSLAPGLNRSLGNPEYHLNKIDGINRENQLTIATGFHWELAPGLSFDPQLSMYVIDNDSRTFNMAYITGGVLDETRSAYTNFGKRIQKQADAVLTYQRTVHSAHNLEAKLGLSYYDREVRSVDAGGRGAATDLIPTLNGSAEPISVGGTESRQVIMGYFGRLNYDYQQKYLFTANVRYDGASNLGNDNKWGFFPGVSVGWNLHREDFWKAFPQDLLRFKLRASYGVNGNIADLSDFHAQGEYAVGTRYGGKAAVMNSRMPNQALQWERSKTFDVGFDLGLWNNRLTVLFDYYRRVTDNLLTDLSLPHSTGFGSIRTNFGTLENRGLELELNASVLSPQSALQWNVSFNAAKTKNMVLQLPENETLNNRVGGAYVYNPDLGDYGWIGGLQEGQPIGVVVAYQHEGVYATDQEAANAPIDNLIPGTDKTKYGGDVIWGDLDGDGYITDRDRVYAGNIFPAWTGGITNMLSYKNMALTLRLDYTSGHTIYNYGRAQRVGQFQGDIGLEDEVLSSWQNQGDITNTPRFYWADQTAQNNLYRGSTLMHEKGDFLAIRELTLSYTVPTAIVERMKIKGLRFNFTGNNLLYFTNYKGLNPEEGGTDAGRYPVPRNFILGLNLSL